MKDKEQQLIDALLEDYQKGYSETKAGETFPVWFDDDQLERIKRVVSKLKL